MSKQLRNFVLAVLDDDHGINETSWHALKHFLQTAGETELLSELSTIIDTCDGRFFIQT
tara:strand:- start:16309 stop:16485 length:177 start_codon:yes stop_codon:yes gene_type:complete